MSHISDTITNCHVLLEKYRWMAGDLSAPPVKLKPARDKASSSKAARPVTPEEEELIANMYQRGKALREIMARTNRGNKTIHLVLKNRKIAVIPVNKTFTYRELRQINKMWQGGATALDISTKMQLNRSSVYRILETLPQRLASAARLVKSKGKGLK